MRGTILLLSLSLLPASAIAQNKGRMGTQAENEARERSIEDAASARRTGDLQRAVDLYSGALSLWYDAGTAKARGTLRLELGDSTGFCADLDRAVEREDGALWATYHATCARRDSVSFAASGLPAGRFPGMGSVVREWKRGDGRTTHRMYGTGEKPDASISTAPGDTVFFHALGMDMPEFPGGEREMFKYLAKTTKYPAEAQNGRFSGVVYITFVVGVDGRLRDVRILRGVHHSLDREAQRVVGGMPAWRPGRYQGGTVPVGYNLPIRFTLGK